MAADIRQKPDAADRRRRQDALAVGLVVERDIAGDDRVVERQAGFAHAFDAVDELAHDLRPFRIAEVHVVGEGDRQGAHRSQVAPALGHRLRPAAARVGLAIARRAIGGERQPLDAPRQPDDRGVAPRPLYRVAHHQMVVLLPDPALAGEVGAADEADERCRRIAVERQAGGVERRPLHRRGPGPLVERRLVDQRADRQVGDDGAVAAQHQPAGVGQPADLGEIELPAGEHGAGLFHRRRPQHHEHALLALRQHDLVGRHRRLAHRHLVEIELEPEAALGAHLDRGRGQPGGAHVLDGDDRIGRHQLEAGLEQQLLGERIADLDGRALFLRIVGELGRRHGGAMDAVAPGLGADIDHRVADPGGGRAEDPAGWGQPDGHRVDQDVAVVGGVEIDFPADRRHAHAIAIAADPGHHPGHQVAGPRVVRAAEAQRVEVGDRPGAHGEDVAHDAADPGRSTLVGLDEGGVVVALHLEDDGLAVADIDHPGILARPLDHPCPGGRQPLQPHLGGLVGAVLAPHHRDDAELGEVGRPAEEAAKTAIFLRRQAVLGDDCWRHRGVADRAAHARARTSPSNSARPSVDPCNGSTAFSGCGIRPSTFLVSLKIPAIARAEPLGLPLPASPGSGQ